MMCSRLMRHVARIVVVLSFAALPAVVPGEAGAAAPACADGDRWDCVARCESSGDWHVNTGNGYYGGLQFAQSTWEEYGGLKHARRADLASRAQQVEVAEQVLVGQGWQAWPVCGRRYGSSRGTHLVRPGDTLWSIARDARVPGGWPELYAANRTVVGPDPDRIAPGVTLTLPPSSETASDSR